MNLNKICPCKLFFFKIIYQFTLDKKYIKIYNQNLTLKI